MKTLSNDFLQNALALAARNGHHCIICIYGKLDLIILSAKTKRTLGRSFRISNFALISDCVRTIHIRFPPYRNIFDIANLLARSFGFLRQESAKEFLNSKNYEYHETNYDRIPTSESGLYKEKVMQAFGSGIAPKLCEQFCNTEKQVSHYWCMPMNLLIA